MHKNIENLTKTFKNMFFNFYKRT